LAIWAASAAPVPAARHSASVAILAVLSEGEAAGIQHG